LQQTPNFIQSKNKIRTNYFTAISTDYCFNN